MRASQRNIVVLGASYAGSSVAHCFLKHIYPVLPKDVQYHLYLVNPSTTLYHRSAAPRAAACLALTKNISMFSDLNDGFKQYSPDSFTFMRGCATGVDLERRTVTIKRSTGQYETLPYHALVFATGSKVDEPILSTCHESLEDLLANINDMNTKVNTSETIIIAGGGPAGVETAGEIGEHLNGAAGWFATRPSNPKAQITLLSGEPKLLPILSPKFSAAAVPLLNRVGVDVRFNTRAVSHTTDPATGKTHVHLSDGSTMTCDLYIRATGATPNTAYAPPEILTEQGFIRTNPATLRVDAAGPRVYCVGDAGSYTRGGLIDLVEAVPAVIANIRRDLVAAHKDVENGRPGDADVPYESIRAETQLVPVGQSRGLGAFAGFMLPNFMVYRFKVRDYFDCGWEFASGVRWVKSM